MTERSGGPLNEHGPKEEPVTIVDNRKIDQDGNPQGDVKEAASGRNDSAPGSDEDAPAGSAEAELAERTADLQRLTAEYANYRRRSDRDRKAAIDSAKAAVVTELLGVIDDLDRARAHGDLESGPLKSVADKLADVLTKQGLEEFGAEGEPFDPTLHEAVQHEGEGHTPVIGMVMRKGYRLGDRVLRHALVGVTDGVADSASTPDTTNTGRDADGAE